ncbi:MAG TPA: DinB family protein [Longimicrobium sp.]|nr:DinB family protein [Longimicrobium sp.]
MSEELAEQVLETWRIHDRINRYLLAAVPAEALAAVSASRGRSVGEQFAHVHNVRLMWLKQAAPELMAGLDKIEKDGAGDAEGLRAALEGSGRAIEELLRRGVEGGGRIKGFKPHAAAFLGYLVSHVPPPRADRSHPQAGRPPAGAKDRLRHLGVGRAVNVMRCHHTPVLIS